MSERLTIREASEYTGISHWTLRNWINAGKLPAKRRGVKILVIAKSDLDELFTDV